MTKVIVTFTLKEGVTKETLVETLQTLTFQEEMSYLEEVVQEFETDDTIYTDL